MHFIKQRAATTGSRLLSLLANSLRPPSNPSPEPNLSYKSHYIEISPDSVRHSNQIPKPPATASPSLPLQSLRVPSMAGRSNRLRRITPLHHQPVLTAIPPHPREHLPLTKQLPPSFHAKTKKSGRGRGCGRTASAPVGSQAISQNPNHHGRRFAARSSQLTRAHLWPPSAAVCFSGNYRLSSIFRIFDK